MELGNATTCLQIRCPYYYGDLNGHSHCEKNRMRKGLFSCREFDIAAERREAGL